MKVFIVFLLFIGMFFIIDGVYEQKLKAASATSKIEYKYIPRTYYDEQLTGHDIESRYDSIFNRASPWFDQHIGEGLDMLKTDIRHE